MTAKRPARRVERDCPYCGNTYTVPATQRRFEAWDNCQTRECMTKGTADYEAALATYKADPQRDVERAARRAARSTPPVVIGGGWAQVGQLVTALDRKSRRTP